MDVIDIIEEKDIYSNVLLPHWAKLLDVPEWLLKKYIKEGIQLSVLANMIHEIRLLEQVRRNNTKNKTKSTTSTKSNLHKIKSQESTKTNKKRTDKIKIKLDGKQYTLDELAELSGIPKQRIYSRYKKGWKGYKLLYPKNPCYMTFNNITLLIDEWKEVLDTSEKEIIELHKRYEANNIDKDLPKITEKMIEKDLIHENEVVGF